VAAGETHDPAQPPRVVRPIPGSPVGLRVPIQLTERDRRDALSYWRKAGVLDAHNRPTNEWHNTVGWFVN
jgi:hypothetical protein